MLRFHTTSDEVFQLILREALDVALDDIRVSAEAGNEDVQDVLPNASKVFDAQTALPVLERLRTCSDAPVLYKPTDYHWLLLYDVLKEYCGLFNEMPLDLEVYKVYGITTIDFGTLVDVFFWDDDFLVSAREMLALTLEQRQQLDFNPETFGLAQGFRPHVEELEFKRVQDEPETRGIIPAIQSEWYQPGVVSYPKPLMGLFHES